MEKESVKEFDTAAAVVFSEESRSVVFPPDFHKAYHLAFGKIPSLKIAPIVGMAGIGKTTLANEIFQHPNITSFFECRVWVKVGRNCAEQIRRSILRQIDPSADETPDEGDERSVRKLLKARRYLVVLDDVWDLQLWRELRNLFDYKRDHSGVLLTTRLQDVALGASDKVVQMSFLNNEESWDLLRTKVFGKQPCPAQLEKAGKKIAEKCDGLPLTIITVANILSKADPKERTPEHWTKIAENKNSVFMDAYKQMYDVLYPSYEELQLLHLKDCFLYMGVFPQKYEIPTSKLIKLWSVENFLDSHPFKTSAELTVEYLELLHSRNLVLTTQESSSGGTKTSRLHSVYLYLCSIEASKNNIFAVLNGYQDCLREGIESQRRFSINNNVLFGIKDVRDRIARTPIVHSLLCFGPYLQYQVPICLQSTSLMVVDALSIRFYEFPEDVEKLEKLKYLGLTFNGQLPHTISKLRFLEFLIIRRHMRIKSSRVSRYLPMEVWEMKSLKHLQVTGCNLPEPNGDALLPNLLTLLDVGVQSCTKNVLERIPNLEKLGIQIDIAPGAARPSSSSSFDYHVSHLEKLKSLKCVIVNPVLIRKKVVVPPRLPDLPLGLKKLSLSGFGYPWEEMSKIASLPNLQVLKLRCFAFRGPQWEARDREFSALKYLLIEDTDLLDWTAAYSSFYRIQRIILKNCYKLLDIPHKFWNNVYADVVDCNPSAAKYNEQHYVPPPHRKVIATNSW